MVQLVALAFGGMIAKFIGGSLGMGYGVMSATMLLGVGIAPAAASATVHIADIGTTVVSGVSHWKFGNVDWSVVRRLALPGAIGAFTGATVLVSLPIEYAVPLMAGTLLVLGGYVMIRFTMRGTPAGRIGTRLRSRFLLPLGLVGGFLDSTGGGGWGPVTTPALLASGRMEPRKVIGSVETCSFVVTVSSTLGFLVSLGFSDVPYEVALALLAGGLVAAPVAAWVVRHLPGRILGSLVGGMIVLTNAHIILGPDVLGLALPVQIGCYTAFGIAWIAAMVWSVRAYRAERAAAAEADQTAQNSLPSGSNITT